MNLKELKNKGYQEIADMATVNADEHLLLPRNKYHCIVKQTEGNDKFPHFLLRRAGEFEVKMFLNGTIMEIVSATVKPEKFISEIEKLTKKWLKRKPAKESLYKTNAQAILRYWVDENQENFYSETCRMEIERLRREELDLEVLQRNLESNYARVRK